MSHSEIIQAGKYRFEIIRHIERLTDDYWTHTYKLGGDYQEGTTIRYLYNNNNQPYRVVITQLLYELAESALGTSLESGGDTEIMIKGALRYAFNDVKTLPKFEFDDMSHIECIDEKKIQPLNLAYLYIAYHGMTWYEARFNAEMIDKVRYTNYRKQLTFLTDPAMKPSFRDFWQIVFAAFDSLETVIYLEELYNTTKTYREFFEAIPESRRCEILSPWLKYFMQHYIGDVYREYRWVIDVEKMDIAKNICVGGSLKKGPHYRIFSYQGGNSLGSALSF